MQRINIIVFLIATLACLNACKTSNDASFNELYKFIDQNNFFKAKELYALKKTDLSVSHQEFIQAVLNNAFNQTGESEKNIDQLLEQKTKLPDSLQFKLYELKYDNAVKLYRYKEAKEATQIILNDYQQFLDSTEIADFKNDLKIWTALESIEPQKITIHERTEIKMTKDIAGLNTLPVSAGNQSFNFIFDTGANLSTTSQSVAKQMNMHLIPVDIAVGTITGTKVMAQLALCDTLTLGNIDLYNTVFLVLNDEGLSFPQINYQIFGILGFPIIEAMNEIQLTKDGDFIVPQEESVFSETSNMALDGLTPLIYLDQKHFSFDTGADQTILYQSFYHEDENKYSSQYTLQKIGFGGAAGKSEFDGYKIDYTLSVGNKEITLKDIALLTEKVKTHETVYGNVGQDLIQQFDTMILNFNHMFIKFE